MDSMLYSQGSNKRQKIATEPLQLTNLPTEVLRNCISYLGEESGYYYFLASVHRDLKNAVEEQYGDNRNTSVDSILSSASTCAYVLNILEQDPTDNVSVLKREKIVDTIFENDRLDLYLDPIVKLYPIHGFHNNLAFLIKAVEYKSTEIMRSHIDGNDQLISFLTNLKVPVEAKLPEGIEITEWVGTDIKNFIQTISAACDPQMIKELVEKGVVFNFKSVMNSLKRKDIETFSCLLDIVPLEEEEEIQSIIIEALHNDLRLEAAKCLYKRNYFAHARFFVTAMYIVITENIANNMDLVKMFCNAKPNLTEIEFNIIVYTCMLAENMEVLSYLHKSFWKIDLVYFRRLAMLNNKPEVAAHLQSLE